MFFIDLLKNKYRLVFEVLMIAVFSIIYVISAKIGLSFSFVNEHVTTIWPPTGLALAILLLFGFRMWPAILIGAFAANILTQGHFYVSVGIAVGNTLEAVFGYYFLQRIGFNKELSRVRDVIAIAVFSAILSTTISATIGVLSISLGGLSSWSAYPFVWLVWWIGDMVGAIIFAPLALAILNKKSWIILKKQIPHFLFWTAVVGISAYLGFAAHLSELLGFIFFYFSIFVVVCVIAPRFLHLGAAINIFIVSIFASWGTLQGSGPFIDLPNIEENLITSQLFVFVLTVGALMIAAAISEKEEEKNEVIAARNDLNKTNSDLEKTLEIIKEEEARDEALLASIGDGLIAIDKDENIIRINQQARELLKIGKEMLIGKKFFDVVPAVDKEGKTIAVSERLTQRALNTGEMVRTPINKTSYYFLRSDGSYFPVAVTATPIRHNDIIIGVITVFRDVTEEIEIDNAKNEFISLASHQLRTPVTAIKWYAELVLKNISGLEPKQVEYIKEIYAASRRMAFLVDDILSVSRLELGKLVVESKPFDIVKMIKSVITDHSILIQQNKLQLNEEYEDDLPEIDSDEGLIRMGIQNIISNAIKYSPQKGIITIKVTLADPALYNKEIGVNKQQVLIEVEDTGYGIPADEQEKVFTKFFRAKNIIKQDTEGTGLGLHIVKSVIDLLGGSISFTSEENKGTKFSILLPMEHQIKLSS